MIKSFVAFFAFSFFISCFSVSICWADAALVINKANGNAELWTGGNYSKALISAMGQCKYSSDVDEKKFCKEYRFKKEPKRGSTLLVVRGKKLGSYRFLTANSRKHSITKLREGGLKYCRKKRRKNCQIVHFSKID